MTLRERLAPRQFQLVLLVGEGHSNAETAERMGITESGCKATLSAIYRRLGFEVHGNSRGRLFQIIMEERAQFSCNGYDFPIGV